MEIYNQKLLKMDTSIKSIKRHLKAIILKGSFDRKADSNASAEIKFPKSLCESIFSL